MHVVLDTNVLLPSIRRTGDLYWIFRALPDGKYTLVVSTPILLEYEEVIGSRTTPAIAHSLMQVLLALPNVERIEPTFRWQLIHADSDDNKFVDAYLAAGADVLVSHDSHFDGLAAIEFPSVAVISASEFGAMLAAM